MAQKEYLAYNILSNFLKALPPPKAGEIREYKDGTYKFIDGHWKKLKSEMQNSNLTDFDLGSILQKLDNLAKHGKRGTSVKFYQENKNKYGDFEEKLEEYLQRYRKRKQEGEAFKLTAEQLAETKENVEELKNGFSDQETIDDWKENYHAKTKNYIPNTYFRVEGGSGKDIAGLGKGLYLGKDKQALINFYGAEEEKDSIIVSKYIGSPKWFDLADPIKKNSFEKFKKEKSKSTEDMAKILQEMGYDGIRYYDVYATGEEFLLFDDKKVKKEESQTKQNNEIQKSINNSSIKEKYVEYADIILVNELGRILLLKRTKDQEMFPGLWGLPGGHIDKGETPKKASIRECEEETGIVIFKCCSFKTKQIKNGTIYYFISYEEEYDNTELFLVEKEHSNYYWCDINKLNKLELIPGLQEILEDIEF